MFIALTIGEYKLMLSVRPLQSVKRWLCEVHVPEVNERTHITKKKCQQQGRDGLTVNIGISHEHYLVVPNFFGREGFTDAPAEGGDHRLHFIMGQGAIESSFFNIENLPAQRQNCLGFWVSTLHR